MQVKIVIGTIAFMLTMIIFGFATLLEPARLQETTQAFEARQVENGAAEFQARCASCHGVNGDAQECFDPVSGEPTGCQGRPLNNAALLCLNEESKSQRMIEMNWNGSLRNLILQTISAGRPGTLMPTWSEQFGGPLEEYQVEQLTSFILNWENEELCGAPAATPVGGPWPEDATELPEGNAENGATLFTSVVPPCSSCHGDPAVPGSNAVGPHLGNIGATGGERIEGISAAQYIYDSIRNPADFVAPICANDQPCSTPSGMPDVFETSLTQQDVADLVAYLLQQTGE
ncbi:MAG: cytochrome c [Chloroflexi bacterium]|nr:cytochrome c [Chloroflexota bacterium]MCI0578741.1 cytochrome c [Chloroflexota bacterium]MCI0643974.1 cytochrome c [Chloroflexota bacterium]MCI0732027.1 cytochrome c [Chloroflexota bacterium]